MISLRSCDDCRPDIVCIAWLEPCVTGLLCDLWGGQLGMSGGTELLSDVSHSISQRRWAQECITINHVPRSEATSPGSLEIWMIYATRFQIWKRARATCVRASFACDPRLLSRLR